MLGGDFACFQLKKRGAGSVNFRTEFPFGSGDFLNFSIIFPFWVGRATHNRRGPRHYYA
jgi:hypothetical protein